MELRDEALWKAFHERTLPADAWTHRAHVRVAWMHLSRWSVDEAHLRARVGIIRLNAFHGLEETPQRGYHETITRAWLALVAAARPVAPGETGTRDDASSEDFLARRPDMLDREAPLRCYSRERLFSLRARTVCVEPDLAPLPEWSELTIR